MSKKDLENTITQKIKPMLDEAMHRALGITVSEIESDISDKIKHNTSLEVSLDISIGFKKAKEQFKKHYVKQLLEGNFGNITRVAELAELDRRSIHRLVTQFKIDVPKFRQDMLKSSYLRQVAVQNIIEDTLDAYKGVLHPAKLETMYKQIPELSRDIIKELPEQTLTLRESEEEFEKLFLEKALRLHNHNQQETAKAIGLRYETLHRKLKVLKLI